MTSRMGALFLSAAAAKSLSASLASAGRWCWSSEVAARPRRSGSLVEVAIAEGFQAVFGFFFATTTVEERIALLERTRRGGERLREAGEAPKGWSIE